jgi:hypothetical protein
MNVTATVFATLSLASAGIATSAAAASQVSDTDYVEASRCRGIAVGLGADAAALNAFVKSQAGGRNLLVQDRADEEFARGKREAKGDGKERLSAELSGACAAFTAPAKAMAAR